MFKKFSLRSQLLGMFVFIGVVTAVTISEVIYSRAREELSAAKMTSLVEVSKVRTQEYFTNLEQSLENFSDLDIVKESLTQFSTAFDSQTSSTPTPKLKHYYDEIYAKEYARLNDGKSTSFTLAGFESLSPRAKQLQNAYIAENPYSIGEKHQLTKVEGVDPYYSIHSKWHPMWNKFLENNHYEDIFLIDDSDRVVYSVFKDVDFASRLSGNGPMSKSLLAETVTKAKQANGNIVLSSMAEYLPSYDTAGMFMAKEITYSEGKKGVVVFQIPAHKVGALLSNNGDYESIGLGKSGEIILRDKHERYIAAPRLEEEKDARAFAPYNDIKEVALERGTMAMLAKASFLPKVDEKTKHFEDIWGRSMIGKTLDFDYQNLGWTITAIKSEQEVYAGMAQVKLLVIYITLGIMSLVALVAWFFSKGITNKINAVASQLNDGSRALASTAQNVSSGSVQLSSATTQQAASLQETVASMEEISSMVAKNDEVTSQSKKISQSASDGARRGQDAIKEMREAINQIASDNESVRTVVAESGVQMESIISIIGNISEKTQVINDIVFQTKLLSFNASVEAARAGEHGKGFAVVAEEVGNLANMSGKAANEISAMLESSIEQVKVVVANTQNNVSHHVDIATKRVQAGAEVSLQCEDVLNTIVKEVAHVDEMLSHISAASREQAAGVQEINEAMSQLDEASNQGAQVAEQASAQAEELSKQAIQLDMMVEELSVILNGTRKKGQKQVSARLENSKDRKASAQFENLSLVKAVKLPKVNDNDDRFEEL